MNNYYINTFHIVKDIIFESEVNYFVTYSLSQGNMSLYKTSVGISGYFYYLDKIYKINSLGGDLGLIYEINQNYQQYNICSLQEGGQSLETYCVGDCGKATLDVLILISPDAKTWLIQHYGNVFYGHYLFESVQTVNTTFINSSISDKLVRFTAIDNFIPDFSWSAQYNFSLRLIADFNSLRASQLATNLRQLYGSDIVVLLTDFDRYGDIRGWAGTTMPNSDNQQVIVDVARIGSSNGGYILAHEIGHLFGCKHQESADPDPECPNAHKLLNTEKHTILNTFIPSNAYIPYYSNPDVNYNNIPTGIINDANNAQQIKKAFCESADNNITTDFNTEIVLDGSICNGQPVKFKSNTFSGQCLDPTNNSLYVCGIPPYKYNWYLSYDEDFTNPMGLCNTKDCEISNFPCNGCNGFFIKLIVTSSDQPEFLIASDIKYFSCPILPCPNSLSKSEDNKFKIYNSFNGLRLNSLENSINSIKFYSLNGKLISTLKSFNCYSQNFNLSSGLYLTKITYSDNTIKYCKFFNY